ncbi:MAG: hypothetical protein AB1491_03780 [Thermodesulfobacteriota bacterium]
MDHTLKGFMAIVAAFTLVFLLGTVPGQTAPADVGLVTKLAGEVTYGTEEAQPKPGRVQAFMKVRQGDLFKLPQGALLQVLFFASGRQETWKGPVTIKAGAGECRAAGKGKPQAEPEVKMLPAKVTKRMSGSALPVPESSLRYSGAIRTMAPACPPKAKPRASLNKQAQAELKEAEKIYQDLGKQAAPDDITPELYFLGVLADYQQCPQMEKVIDTMLRKQPGNAALKKMQGMIRSPSAPPE